MSAEEIAEAIAQAKARAAAQEARKLEKAQVAVQVGVAHPQYGGSLRCMVQCSRESLMEHPLFGKTGVGRTSAIC
jgi:hypothetical protein